MRFAGHTVIVTGAGSGIGEAAAKRFLTEGANVVVNGRNREKLEKAFAASNSKHVLIAEGDVSKEQDVIALVARTIDQFGGLNTLVNNAAIAEMGDITDTTTDLWKKTFAINVDGVFYGCKAAMPHLVKSKGSIVNIASVSGLGGDYRMAAYNAAKGAITNLTRALAIDHGRDGVRVNAICPSLTITEMTKDMLDNAPLMVAFQNRSPLGRAATPEDIAGAIAFLASDDARFVTGVNLPVDGGVSASNGQPIYFT